MPSVNNSLMLTTQHSGGASAGQRHSPVGTRPNTPIGQVDFITARNHLSTGSNSRGHQLNSGGSFSHNGVVTPSEEVDSDSPIAVVVQPPHISTNSSRQNSIHSALRRASADPPFAIVTPPALVEELHVHHDDAVTPRGNSDTSEEHHEWRISLKVLLAIVIATTTIICGAIAITPIYKAAIDSSTVAAQHLSEDVADKVTNAIGALLVQARWSYLSVKTTISNKALNYTDNDSIIAWLGHWQAQTNMYFLLYRTDGNSVIMWYGSPFNASVVPPPGQTVFSIHRTSTMIVEFRFLYADNLTEASPPFVQKLDYQPAARPFYNVLVVKECWAPIFVDVSKRFPDLMVGGPVIDPIDGGIRGFISVVLPAVTIINYLKELKLTSTGRAALFDAPSEGILGTNTDDPTVRTDPATGAVTVATADNLVDPILRETFRLVGKANIFHCVDSCPFVVQSSDGGNLFVRVKAITDGLGLDIRAVVVMPEVDLIGPININTRNGVLAAAGAILGLLLLNGAVLWYILDPLRSLEEHLYSSATLRDTGADGDARGGGSSSRRTKKKSFLREIYNIEVAYTKLQVELQKVKSFLPQSVLRQLDEDGQRDAAGVVVETEEDGDANFRNTEPETAAVQPASLAASTVASREADPSRQHRCSVTGEQNPLEQSGDTKSSGSSSFSPHNAFAAGANNSSTTSSSKRPGGSRVVKVKKGLSTSSALQTKNVTVVMGNIIQFHKTLEAIGHGELVKQHAAVVETILLVVNQAKGVLDSFHGDHFTITFNASTSCPAHGIRAAAVVLKTNEILRSRSAVGRTTALRFGAATGSALCGNFGTDRMRRFCTVGPVVNHAFAMMIQTAAEGVINLCTSTSFEVMSSEFSLQHVNYVVLPQTNVGSLISTIVDPSLLLQTISTALQPSPNTLSPNGQGGGLMAAVITRGEILRRINDAFEAFARGDLNAAKTLTGRVPREYAGGLLKSIKSVMEMRH